MPFKKGKPKTGGRDKGKVNKKTLILDSFAEVIATGGMEKFKKELNKLSGAAYVKAYMVLFEFVKPKLARSEVDMSSGGQPIKQNVIKLRDGTEIVI